MLRTRQIDLAKRILAHREAGRGTDLADATYQVDPAIYCEPSILDDEVNRIFRRRPLLACMSAEVHEPGDFITTDLLDVPVLVVRGDDGVVRAFRNSCRHRGAVVAEGKGCAPKFSCPFHGWTYRRDGSLVSTTHPTGFDDIDMSKGGLAELACGEVSGLVFVRLSGPPGLLDAAGWLGPLADELAHFGYESYHALPRPAAKVGANWKLIYDGNCESWHSRFIHRATIDPLISSDHAVFDPFDLHSLVTYPRKTIGVLTESTPEEWDFLPHASCTYLILPNTVLINMVDHVELFRIYPEAVDLTRIELTLYTPTPPDADERAERHWRRQAEALERTVQSEDFPVSEGAQRALRTATAPLTYGRNEPALIHFHRGLERLLADDALGAG